MAKAKKDVETVQENEQAGLVAKDNQELVALMTQENAGKDIVFDGKKLIAWVDGSRFGWN